MGLRDRLHERWAERGIDVPATTFDAPTATVAPVEAKPKVVRAPRVLITGPTDAPVTKRAYDVKARICAYDGCGIVVTGSGWRFCAEHAAIRERERNRARDHKRPPRIRKMTEAKRCDWCGTEYVRSHATQRYCSTDCSTKSKYQRKNESRQRSRDAMTKQASWPCPNCGGSLAIGGAQWDNGVMVRYRRCACGHRMTTEERAR